jgi:hypothetical protein
MTRKSRIDAAGALHHIIARGIDRSKIFQDPTDKRNFLKRLAEILKRELGISMAKLSRRMNVSVMAVSYAVQRREKIAREFNFSL